MDGLEAREFNYLKSLDNKDFRIDSQFYTQMPKKNLALSYDKIGNKLIKSQYGISISMNEDDIGYPIYRMNEIHNMFCDLEVDKCADITPEELNIFSLNDGDVLFNRTNSFEWVGRTGIYKQESNKKNIFASYLVRFVPDVNYILPEYLTTFLNSKQGVWDIKRRARQSINQTNVNPEEVKEIEIPLLSMDIQKKIKTLFDISYENICVSSKLYKEAEDLLLSELGLLDFVPNNDNIAIKSFSDSFSVSGRLDSEYYQPKYDDIVLHIKQAKHDKLDHLVSIKKSIEPGSEAYQDEGIPFVRVSNLSKFELTAPDIHLAYSLFSVDELEKLQPKKDTILLSKDGTVGMAYCMKEDANLVTSGALLHLNIRQAKRAEVLPEYLTLILNSKVVQMQAERDAGGSIIQHWKPSEIQEILIPILSMSIQEQIETKVMQSFILKEQSKQLLELAKRAVEVSIEESEQSAFKLIGEYECLN
ncbi:MAG: restriction endonuclease subunit S [Sphingobacteriaceae bacterium]|nr:restriction endonuclease subunit S [Sphingobacteriaceae bacterium]